MSVAKSFADFGMLPAIESTDTEKLAAARGQKTEPEKAERSPSWRPQCPQFVLIGQQVKLTSEQLLQQAHHKKWKLQDRG